MKKILALVLALAMVLSFAACGNKNAADLASSLDGALIVAEAGSAGADVMKDDDNFAKAEPTEVGSMAAALMEVASGTADGAVVDKITAIGSIGEGTSYTDLVIVDGYNFPAEEYGIAFRKGSDLTAAVNEIIADLMTDGSLDAVAQKYKLGEQLIKDGKAQADEATVKDIEKIKEKGELVIGITLFAPMNYKDDSGKLVGFETEFAEAVCAKLGVSAKFQIIDWNSKEIELNSGNIDCIWNGMTITDDRLKNMSISVPYMKNEQVLVAKK